ncbi:hypothetical protein QFC21_001999 [Naganishia friedmannii]|uniref:Uncharacterized protein n=1 Tax=Naganishia friedmannii TaxID=89922 RepID=A0ACC2VZ84_9TREE|nr:hypothetical protein QFC21_001999 [Naganishia friedmannii]
MDVPDHIGRRFYPFSRFIGYRPGDNAQQPIVMSKLRSKAWVTKAENIVQSVVGAWVALTLLALAARAAPFHSRHVPVIVGSFGADITYGMPQSSKVVASVRTHLTRIQAQPRNIVLSMPISAVIGMGVGKLFAMQDDSLFPSEYGKQWASSSTAVALSLLVTQEISVPHPPGGATALLAASNQQIFDLGWFYVGYVMTGSMIMLGWGLIINNIGRRRYPQYWITPEMIPHDDHPSEKQQLQTAPGSAKPGERQA